VGPGGVVSTAVDVELTVGDNFAAMDEVSVGGGELRLVEPRKTHDPAGATVTAIGFPLRTTEPVRSSAAGY
jgi:hypothetical protein